MTKTLREKQVVTTLGPLLGTMHASLCTDQVMTAHISSLHTRHILIMIIQSIMNRQLMTSKNSFWMKWQSQPQKGQVTPMISCNDSFCVLLGGYGDNAC